MLRRIWYWTLRLSTDPKECLARDRVLPSGRVNLLGLIQLVFGFTKGEKFFWLTEGALVFQKQFLLLKAN